MIKFTNEEYIYIWNNISYTYYAYKLSNALLLFCEQYWVLKPGLFQAEVNPCKVTLELWYSYAGLLLTKWNKFPDGLYCKFKF